MAFEWPKRVGSPMLARAGRRSRYLAAGFFIMADESLDIRCGFVIPASGAADGG